MSSKHPRHGDASYLIFLVEDIIFHVPVRRLRQSQYFCDMIDDAHTGKESEGKSDDDPIVLGGISAFEMACFLDVLETPFVFGDPKLSFEQWAAALHLAIMWSFGELRKAIISQMDNLTANASPFDVIKISQKCRVEKWSHPAYAALCRRQDSFTDDEVEWLGIKRAAAIWRIRESLEFDKPSEIPPYSSCCRARLVCGSCFGTGSRQQPAAKGGKSRLKARVVNSPARARSVTPPGSPTASNHVLELIKAEEALKFA